MSSYKLFTLNHNNKDITIMKSEHTLTSRRGTFSRDHNLLKKDYKDILSIALIQGLTSFRDKGRVVISFSDTDKVHYSILVEISKTITIVSVYYSTHHKTQRNNFIKEKHRINLTRFYTLDLHEVDKKVVYIRTKMKKALKTSLKKIRKVGKPTIKKQKYNLDNPIDYKDVLLFENSMENLI